jgi:hypothetical protein
MRINHFELKIISFSLIKKCIYFDKPILNFNFSSWALPVKKHEPPVYKWNSYFYSSCFDK